MRRLPGDKTDVWLVRYNGLGPANFWGFKQLSYRYRHQRHMHAAALPMTFHIACQSSSPSVAVCGPFSAAPDTITGQALPLSACFRGPPRKQGCAQAGNQRK